MGTSDGGTYVLPDPPPLTKAPRRRWVTPFVTGVVAFIVGATAGVVGTQSQITDLRHRAESAEARIVTLEEDVATAQAEAAERLEQLRAKQSELSTLRSESGSSDDEVRRLELEIERLEEQLAQANKPAPRSAPGPRRTFGDGIYRVGKDIDPGTYRASGGSNCYWARLSGFSGNLGQIIANGIGSPHPLVTISASDVGFESQRCGTWTRV
jgi:hypothetical protein